MFILGVKIMIQIHDNIVKHLDSLTREEFRLLLILSKYITEGVEVSKERLLRFYPNEKALGSNLSSLVARLGWKLIACGDRGWEVIDTTWEETRSLRITADFSPSGSSKDSVTYQFTVLPPKGGSIVDRKGTESFEDADEGKILQQTLQILEDLVNQLYERKRGEVVNIVNHFIAKKRQLDPAITADARERGRNIGHAKFLINKYPSLDHGTWIKAIDFFFNDPFWAQHFTSLIFLDKHLQKFLIKRPKSSPKFKAPK